MPKNKKIILIIICILIALAILALAIYFIFFRNKTTKQINQPNNSNTSKQVQVNTNSVPQSQYAFPIQNFLQNQTKKKFGQYITPATSPIQPERFQGYHTAVDIEINPDQVNVDVPVYAVQNSQVVYLNWVSGYGGVIILQGIVDNQPVTFLYGHIRLSSVNLKVGDQVKKGQQIAVLGNQYSTETDGERKHLHFSIHKGTALELRGYVQDPNELQAWYNPDDIIK